MASFEQAQSQVKIFEGGYQAHPEDKGNYVDGELIGTNHGISAPVLKAYLGRKISVADMKGLSYETALKIYRQQYWNYFQLDRVNNQSVALLIYDGAVNQGQGRMKGIIIDSLRTVGLSIDNNSTIGFLVNKINSAPQQQLFDAIKSKRLAKYNKDSYAYNSWAT